MAPPQSAYQTENFDPFPDEELICSICRCVFYDPVECLCRHVYCRICIKNWLAVRKTCPICRKRTTTSELKTVVPIIKNMIMKLTIHCPNSEYGCKQNITLETYDSHLETCDYSMLQCKNINCKENYIRKDMFKHEQNECKHRFIKCDRRCSLFLPINSLKSHDCIEELKKELNGKEKLIEELKNEIETIKCSCRKVKEELEKLKNENSIVFTSEEEYNSFDSSNIRISNSSNSDHSIPLNHTENNDNPYDNSHERMNTTENANTSETPYMTSFVNALMSVFPTHSLDEHNVQNEQISNYGINQINDDNLENSRNDFSLAATCGHLNNLSLDNIPGTNSDGSHDENSTELYGISEPENVESNAEISRDTCSSELSHETYIEQEDNYSNEEFKDNSILTFTRRRLLKRKPLRILSDTSVDSDSESYRMRRINYWRNSSKELILDNRDEFSAIAGSYFDESFNSEEQNKTVLSINDVNLLRHGNYKNLQNKKIKKRRRSNRDLISRNSGMSKSSTGDINILQENEVVQSEFPSQYGKTRSYINQDDCHRSRSLQRIPDFTEPKKIQRGLSLIEGCSHFNQVTVGEICLSASRESNNTKFLNKYIDESDTDSEILESESEDSDFSFSNDDLNANHGVNISEKTLELLERYSKPLTEEDSDRDPTDQIINDKNDDNNSEKY